MHFHFRTNRQTYAVNDKAEISRVNDPLGQLAPSQKWRFLAIVRYNNFGRPVEQIALSDLIARLPEIQWVHKNGKPIWHVVDFDHGTTRHWGNGICSMYKVEETV
jgi:hypothetical protein